MNNGTSIGAVAARKEPQVVEQLNRLNGVVQDIDETVNNLEIRLGGVLRSEPSSPPTPTEAEPCFVPVASSTFAIYLTARRTQTALRRILDLLEV